MCDSDVLKVIEAKVNEKTLQGEMFTAHDITKVVRIQVGRSVNVQHREVRQEVHNLFAQGNFGPDYTRSLGSFPGVNPQPWIYHRNTDDAATYGVSPAGIVALIDAGIVALIDPSSLTAINPPQPQQQQDGDAHDDAVNKQADGAFKVDGRDTLCLPASLVRGAGLVPQEEAFVAQDLVNNAVVVSKNEQPSLTQLSKYTVDNYANVRITQHTLQKAGLGGKVFDIELVNGQFVRVKKHN